jgi:hypothetical protein
VTNDLTQSTSNLAELYLKMAELDLKEMEDLQAWIEANTKARKAEEALKHLSSKKGREVLEIRCVGKITYQREKIKCGKKKCKCNKGKLHGPYWYAYSWNGKKLTSKYIGKELETDDLNDRPTSELQAD